MILPEITNVHSFIYTHGNVEEAEVPVSSEYHMTLKINGNPFVSIACSGGNMEVLAMGHLISEGIIRSHDELKGISVDEKNVEVDVQLHSTDELLERLFRIRSIASGCGQGPGDRLSGEITYRNSGIDARIEPADIINCMNDFLHLSNHHKLTRGVHSAALYDLAWRQIYFSDEIGRHNAIDKIAGYAFINRISLQDKMIFSTGRLSSEIISKGLTSGILGVLSKSAPTSLSVAMAKKFNLLLVGKITRSQFVIFSGRDKLNLPPA